MCRPVFALILIILLLGYPALSQQEQPYSATLTSWRLPYTRSYSQKQNFGNYILEELAKDLLRPPRFVNVSIGFRQEIGLHPLKTNAFAVLVTFKDFNLSGNLQYRSFPVKDVLMPSAVRFSLRTSARLDTSDFKLQDFEGQIDGEPAILAGKADISDFDSVADTIRCSGFSFTYSAGDWQRFNQRKSLIDDYYASVALIDSLLEESRSWDMRDTAQIAFNYIRLSELVKVLELVNDRDFAARLINKGGDKSRLLEKYLALYKVSRTCQFNLAETIEKPGITSVYIPADSISNYFIGRLMRFIRLSSLMENIQGLIYQDYLNTFFSRKVFENDGEVMKQVLLKTFPGIGSDTLLSWASQNLMQSYRRKALELIGEKRFYDAVLLIGNSKSMAKVNPYLRNPNGWEQLMSAAVNGIYNSYAGIASSSLSGRNTNFAMEYLQKAEDYRAKYPEFITSDSVYRRVYRSIFVGQLEHCDSLLEHGDYADALDCLRGCETTYKGRILEILRPDIIGKKTTALLGLISSQAGKCKKALKAEMNDSALVCYDNAVKYSSELSPGSVKAGMLDSLAPTIARIRVKKINALANAYYNHLQFTRAILQFEQAERLSAAYSIPPDASADSVYRQAYKQWLLDRISQEKRLIWGNMPDSALNFLRLAKESARNKGLEADPVITRAISGYHNEITNYACSIMQDSLSLLNIRAGRSFAMNNYYRGVKILKYAIFRAGLTESCKFDLRPLTDSIEKYTNAAVYQENLEKANVCMTTGEYEKGLQLLAQSQDIYTQKRIDHFGIPLVSVYEFIMAKANPFISMQALEYYMNNGDPKEALRYLSLLHMQELPSDRLDVCQEKLARILASKDKLVYINADPQNIVKRYSGSNSWMGKFTDVYIREWKK